MTNQKGGDVQLFDHYKDERAQSEIDLTNRLAHLLTERNLHPFKKESKVQSGGSIRKEEFLFICLCGIPPMDNEFAALKLPGQTIQFKFPAFQQQRNHELQTMDATWQYITNCLHQAISKRSQRKPVVFVHHSYGTYVMIQYLQRHPEFRNRIVGLIDMGGAPIRFYPMLQGILADVEGLSLEQFKAELDQRYEANSEGMKALNMFAYKNKYEYLAVSQNFVNNVGFKDMFSLIRKNTPAVLKCIVYGKDDMVFPQDHHNQKAVHFCSALSEDYLKPYNQAYARQYGQSCSNVQERFIYGLEKGQHTLHFQRRFKSLLPDVVDRYLRVLEEGLNASPTSKL